MTPIGSLGVGDYVTARVFTHHISNPGRQFVNTYEFRCNTVAPGTGEFGDLAQTIKDFHTAMHLDICMVDRIVISTYEQEEGSYDPTSFIVYPFGELGTRTGVGDPLPANCVLYLKRSVLSGRSGKMHLRLALGESEIVAPAGVAQLANPGGMADILSTALDDSSLAAYFAGTSPTTAFEMVLISAWGDPPALGHRFALNLNVGGVRVTNPNHRWYDLP